MKKNNKKYVNYICKLHMYELKLVLFMLSAIIVIQGLSTFLRKCLNWKKLLANMKVNCIAFNYNKFKKFVNFQNMDVIIIKII